VERKEGAIEAMFAIPGSAELTNALIGYAANVLVGSTVLLLAVWALQVWLRHRAPDFRRWLWLVALLLCPLVPFLAEGFRAMGAPSVELGWLPVQTQQGRWVAGDAVPVEVVQQRAVDTPIPQPLRQMMEGGAEGFSSYRPARAPDDFPGASVVPVAWDDSPPSPGSIALVLAAGYLIGGITLLALLGFGIVRLLRWIKLCRPVTDEAALAIFRAAAEEAGCSDPFFLVEGVPTTSPLTMGYLHPKILVPDGFGEGFEREELHDVAKHELTHVRHRDPLSFVFLAIVRSATFFSPLVWVAINRVKLLAEQSADWSVASARERTLPYTRLLLKMAEAAPVRRSPAEAAAGFLFGKSVLLKRSEALLSRDGGYGKVGTVRGIVASLGFAVGLVAAMIFNVVQIGGAAVAAGEDARPLPEVARVVMGATLEGGAEGERWFIKLLMADATVLGCEYDAAEGSPTFDTWFVNSGYPGDPQAEPLERGSAREKELQTALDRWLRARLQESERDALTMSSWHELSPGAKVAYWPETMLLKAERENRGW